MIAISEIPSGEFRFNELDTNASTACLLISQLCGDNADCTFDALLAGEAVGQATLEAEEADRAYQEQVGGERVDGGGRGGGDLASRRNLQTNRGRRVDQPRKPRKY